MSAAAVMPTRAHKDQRCIAFKLASMGYTPSSNGHGALGQPSCSLGVTGPMSSPGLVDDLVPPRPLRAVERNCRHERGASRSRLQHAYGWVNAIRRALPATRVGLGCRAERAHRTPPSSGILGGAHGLGADLLGEVGLEGGELGPGLDRVVAGVR